MKKAYIVTWFNGERWREDQEEKIVGVFSTMEKAQSYVDKWRDDYKKDSDEIATRLNYYEFSDYSFEFYFPEKVWIKEYDLQ